MGAPVVIVDYDPRWVDEFQAESRRIWAAIGSNLTVIEHVGSTAVPGLAAKPVIDMLAGVRSLADAPACIAPLQALGYIYIPEYEDELPERRYFQRRRGEEHTHHLHMVETTSAFWEKELLFRDYLRSHAETAAAYGQLKRKLAAQFGRDRAGYTDAKTEFITTVLAQARKD